MRGVHLFCFLLILPALAVLGHDIYLAFFSEDTPDGQPFQLSDLGWLWVQYGPETYDWAKMALDEETWTNIVEPLLTQTSIVAAIVPAAIIYALLVLCKIIGIWPFRGEGLNLLGKAGRDSGSVKKAKGPMKYKRK